MEVVVRVIAFVGALFSAINASAATFEELAAQALERFLVGLDGL